MATVEVFLIPALTDNYIFVLRDHLAAKTAVIDPALSSPVLHFLDEKNWSLDEIWNTHHHPDHTDGNLGLQKKFNCLIRCYSEDQARIPGDKTLHEAGSSFSFGHQTVFVKDLPGHTIGHICFWIKDQNLLFSGDTLFAMGCGRLFEGTPQQMWSSLSWMAQLPPQTTVYCTHEYTLANGEFALSVEPENEDLQQRIQKAKQLRQQKQATIPTSIKLEKETNPFLRPHSHEIRQNLNMLESTDVEIFTRLRQLKDQF